VWGHYAKAQLILATDPHAAATALRAAIETAPSIAERYKSLLQVEERSLKDPDATLAVAELIAAQGLASEALRTLT
jgi:hypothetical protein